MKTAIILASFVLLLGGCDKFAALQQYGAGATAHAFVANCQISQPTRLLNQQALQNAIGELGHPGNVIAQDCDGDGDSDF